MATQHTSTPEEVHNAWVGTLMIITASFVTCFGLNMQKLSHNRNEVLPDGERVPMYMSWRWLLGFCIMIMGSVIDTSALPYVTMSRVAALGATGMVANIIVTPVFLGEKLTKHDLIGGTTIVIGTTLACISGSSSSPRDTSETILHHFTETPFLCYAAWLQTCLVLLKYLMTGFEKRQAACRLSGFIGTTQSLECVRAWQRLSELEDVDSTKETFSFYTQYGPQFYPVVYAVFAGTLGALNVTFVKVALLFVGSAVRGVDTFRSWGTAGLFLIPVAFCLSNQIKYLNYALKMYRDALFVLPVYQSAWISVGIVTGLVFYREYESMRGWDAVVFAAGVLLSLFGLSILMQRKSATPTVITFEKRQS